MDTVSEIKNRLNIVDVVREYGTLHPSGSTGSFKMVCPFHDDHSPSMIVNEKKGLAWCFVCNSGGDIFSFVQKIEGCSFPEAVHLLADKAGVAIKDYNPEETKREDQEKERIFRTLEQAASFFEGQLQENKRAKEILERRNLPKEVLKKFQVGFAPLSGHSLERHLLEKGFSRKEMLIAGLVVAEDKTGKQVRDKFKNRIMFPIWNSRGRICGFGGRYIGDSDKAPKYLNSPETPVFKKSGILYGLHFAKQAIKKTKYAVLTEGYFDVIACHAAGIENAIATSGTAFTQEQATLIHRYGKEVALALDVDVAGQSAARRSAEIALKKKLEVTVISIPGGKDPDESIRENKEEFLKAIEEKKTCIQAFIERAFLHRDPKKIEEKKRILDEILPVVGALPREIERDHYLHILAEKIGSRVPVLEEEYRRFSRFSNTIPEKKSVISKTKRISPFQYLLGILLSYPHLYQESEKHFLVDLLPENEEKKIYKLIGETYTASADVSPETIFQKIPQEEAEKWKVLALYAENKNSVLPEAVIKEECIKIIHNINVSLIPKKLNELSTALKQEKSDGPMLLTQINELTKLLHKFHHQNG